MLSLRRACSPHARVARISRSIGNSDTTMTAYPWQGGEPLESLCNAHWGITQKRHSSTIAEPQKCKTPLDIEWRSMCLCCSLASQHRTSDHSTCRFFSGFPAGLFRFRTAHWRWLVPGTHSLLAGWPSSPCRCVTGAIYIAIDVPFGTRFVFN